MAAEDILLCAFHEYEKLNGRDYLVTLSDGYAFCLSFKSLNFKHLAGLHYLSDIDDLARNHPERIYRAIRNGFITEDYIRKSAMFEKIHERLFDMRHLSKILRKGAQAIHPFDRDIAHTTIQSDVLIYEEDRFAAFLTLACLRDRIVVPDGSRITIYVPESFMNVPNDKFIRGQTRVHVDGFSEIPR